MEADHGSVASLPHTFAVGWTVLHDKEADILLHLELSQAAFVIVSEGWLLKSKSKAGNVADKAQVGCRNVPATRYAIWQCSPSAPTVGNTLCCRRRRTWSVQTPWKSVAKFWDMHGAPRPCGGEAASATAAWALQTNMLHIINVKFYHPPSRAASRLIAPESSRLLITPSLGHYARPLDR
ncbi:hypothetical protein BCV70DRAFT_61417 [Testicularia cyperi]|uniref:Uncharacterized protein n=1 Tax=Testicularia cyperi TaxID=1882483 RepID=A0A317XWV3_9BASI|nr:hypothetical protein BCV70DRAFT_61417 [Testicularia cyperi]